MALGFTTQTRNISVSGGSDSRVSSSYNNGFGKLEANFHSFLPTQTALSNFQSAEFANQNFVPVLQYAAAKNVIQLPISFNALNLTSQSPAALQNDPNASPTVDPSTLGTQFGTMPTAMAPGAFQGIPLSGNGMDASSFGANGMPSQADTQNLMQSFMNGFGMSGAMGGGLPSSGVPTWQMASGAYNTSPSYPQQYSAPYQGPAVDFAPSYPQAPQGMPYPGTNPYSQGGGYADPYSQGYGSGYSDPSASQGGYGTGYTDPYASQGGYGTGYSDPYASQGGYSSGYADPYASQGGYGNSYSDPYASQGGYGTSNGNPYASQGAGYADPYAGQAYAGGQPQGVYPSDLVINGLYSPPGSVGPSGTIFDTPPAYALPQNYADTQFPDFYSGFPQLQGQQPQLQPQYQQYQGGGY